MSVDWEGMNAAPDCQGELSQVRGEKSDVTIKQEISGLAG